MGLPWFRLYSEFAEDPKVQMMDESMQRRLVMLFCYRCKNDRMGSDSEIAFSLRISPSDCADTKKEFISRGFIDDSWKLLHWDDRQFISDSSYERVKRYRDKRQAKGLSRGSSHLSDPHLYQRDGNRCIYCESTINLCIDHIYPALLGGTDDYDNLGVACKACNSGKSGRTPEQANYRIKNLLALDRYRNYLTCNGFTNGSEQLRSLSKNRTDSEQNKDHTTAPGIRYFDDLYVEP